LQLDEREVIRDFDTKKSPADLVEQFTPIWDMLDRQFQDSLSWTIFNANMHVLDVKQLLPGDAATTIFAVMCYAYLIDLDSYVFCFCFCKVMKHQDMYGTHETQRTTLR
jgi:hypothetical protein